MGNPWAMAAFTSFVCLAAGLLIAVAAAEYFEYQEHVTAGGAVATLLALVVGASCFMGNIGRPEMLLGILGNPQAAIFPELVAMCAALVCALLYLLVLVRGCKTVTAAAISVTGAIVGLGLLAAVGKSFYLPWKPAWNTVTIVFPFIAWGLLLASLSFSALSNAAGFHIPRSRRASLAAVALVAATTILYFATLLLGGNAQAAAAQTALTGELSPLFWGVVCFVGLVVPAAIVQMSRKGWTSTAMTLLCLVCVIVACAAFQFVINQLGMPSWHFFRR